MTAEREDQPSVPADTVASATSEPESSAEASGGDTGSSENARSGGQAVEPAEGTRTGDQTRPQDAAEVEPAVVPAVDGTGGDVGVADAAVSPVEVEAGARAVEERVGATEVGVSGQGGVEPPPAAAEVADKRGLIIVESAADRRGVVQVGSVVDSASTPAVGRESTSSSRDAHEVTEPSGVSEPADQPVGPVTPGAPVEPTATDDRVVSSVDEPSVSAAGERDGMSPEVADPSTADSSTEVRTGEVGSSADAMTEEAAARETARADSSDEGREYAGDLPTDSDAADQPSPWFRPAASIADDPEPVPSVGTDEPDVDTTGFVTDEAETRSSDVDQHFRAAGSPGSGQVLKDAPGQSDGDDTTGGSTAVSTDMSEGNPDIDGDSRREVGEVTSGAVAVEPTAIMEVPRGAERPATTSTELGARSLDDSQADTGSAFTNTPDDTGPRSVGAPLVDIDSPTGAESRPARDSLIHTGSPTDRDSRGGQDSSNRLGPSTDTDSETTADSVVGTEPTNGDEPSTPVGSLVDTDSPADVDSRARVGSMIDTGVRSDTDSDAESPAASDSFVSTDPPAHAETRIPADAVVGTENLISAAPPVPAEPQAPTTPLIDADSRVGTDLSTDQAVAGPSIETESLVGGESPVDGGSAFPEPSTSLSARESSTGFATADPSTNDEFTEARNRFFTLSPNAEGTGATASTPTEAVNGEGSTESFDFRADIRAAWGMAPTTDAESSGVTEAERRVSEPEPPATAGPDDESRLSAGLFTPVDDESSTEPAATEAPAPEMTPMASGWFVSPSVADAGQPDAGLLGDQRPETSDGPAPRPLAGVRPLEELTLEADAPAGAPAPQSSYVDVPRVPDYSASPLTTDDPPGAKPTDAPAGASRADQVSSPDLGTNRPIEQDERAAADPVIAAPSKEPTAQRPGDEVTAPDKKPTAQRPDDRTTAPDNKLRAQRPDDKVTAPGGETTDQRPGDRTAPPGRESAAQRPGDRIAAPDRADATTVFKPVRGDDRPPVRDMPVRRPLAPPKPLNDGAAAPRTTPPRVPGSPPPIGRPQRPPARTGPNTSQPADQTMRMPKIPPLDGTGTADRRPPGDTPSARPPRSTPRGLPPIPVNERTEIHRVADRGRTEPPTTRTSQDTVVASRHPFAPPTRPVTRPEPPAQSEQRPRRPEGGQVIAPRPQIPAGPQPRALSEPVVSRPEVQPETPPGPRHSAVPSETTIRRRRRGRKAAIAVATVLALTVAAVFVVGPDKALRMVGLESVTVAAPPAPVAPNLVLRANDSAVPGPTRRGVTEALATVSGSPALGTMTGVVADPATGERLWSTDAEQPLVPGSTLKLLTAAAALLTLDHQSRLTTTVVQGTEPGTAILVGGGDPTLTALPTGKSTVYGTELGRIDDLVAQIKASGKPINRLQVDISRYAPERLAPGWTDGDITGGYIAPIQPLMLDGGRGDPQKSVSARSDEPALDAGRVLADRLGLPSSAVSIGQAPADAVTLATARSAPIRQLVETSLLTSDNVLAEVLAHEVAKDTGGRTDHNGAATAIREVLSRNGFDITNLTIVDGSGLSAEDRVPAVLLGQVLAAASAGPGTPNYNAERSTRLRPLLSGLPVAAGSLGTLSDRYQEGASLTGRGWVRAKTGTLSGVSSLAGLVTDSEGRLLVFALMSNGTSPDQARPALDAVAAKLRSCGCR